MMDASNNFAVVGFICKDAEVRNFEKSSIARFGVSINITEKRENTPTLFSSRTPRPITTKTSHSSLKKGKRKEVTSKQKRPVTRMAKNYYLPKTSHHLQKVKQKEEEADSFISPA